MAQRDRDGERLVLGIGGLDHRDGGQRRLGMGFEPRVGGALPPQVGRRRGAQRFADQALAPARRRERRDGVAGNADAREQRLQRELRMAGSGRRVPTLRQPRGSGRRWLAGDQPPRRLVEIGIEARQHHGTVRQARDHRDQLRRGRDRAGRAGHDHRRVGVAGKARRLRLDQRVAARRRLDMIALAQDRRPSLARDLQEFQRELPIRIERVRHQLVELVPRHAAHGHVVDQARQIVGQRARRRRRLRHQWNAAVGANQGRLRPFADEPRQQQAPFEPAERWRQRERIGRDRAGRRLGERDFILVDIADGDDARQDGGVVLQNAEEGVAGEPAGAPRRQIKRDSGERQRIVGEPKAEPAAGQGGYQRRQKRRRRRNREHAWGHPTTLSDS